MEKLFAESNAKIKSGNIKDANELLKKLKIKAKVLKIYKEKL